jgi:hypothetical protein
MIINVDCFLAKVIDEFEKDKKTSAKIIAL